MAIASASPIAIVSVVDVVVQDYSGRFHSPYGVPARHQLFRQRGISIIGNGDNSVAEIFSEGTSLRISSVSPLAEIRIEDRKA